MKKIFIGLMSGTSADGINAALVDFSEPTPQLMSTHYHPFSPDLQTAILSFCKPAMNEIQRMGELDKIIGKLSANAVLALLKKSKLSAKDILAIGSHGQTLRHIPSQGFTLQVGDPNIIAAETGITTIADFRRRDMALGGQGAPLVPAFHHAIFVKKDTPRAIVNIGGIANITLLPTDDIRSVVGFDTGPGNTLLDAWTKQETFQPYDKAGSWAASGSIHQPLLKTLLNDPFFALPHPKSTGPDYFNMTWLKRHISASLLPENIQCTLVELTAQSIIQSIQQHLSQGDIFICGGGVHNDFLMKRLRILAHPFTVQSTEQLGVDPGWVESMAFAWLAKQTLDGRSGNIPAVTGAKKATVLGGSYTST